MRRNPDYRPGREGLSGRLLWELFWPWLFYEFIVSFLYVSYGWYFSDMAVMLLAMIFSLPILGGAYYYREKKRKEQENVSETEKKNRANCQGLCRGRSYLMLAVTAAAFSLFLNLSFYYTGWMQKPGGHETVNEVLYSAPFWQQLLVLGLAAPVTEELIYRGLAYRRLRLVWGIFPAAAASAVLFAVFHGNLLQAAYTGLLGFFLALVFEWAGFAGAVWFHLCANLTSLGMTYLGAGYPGLTDFSGPGIGLWIISGILSIAGGFRLIKENTGGIIC